MDQKETDFLAKFIFESDAIEGIQDDLDLLKRQLEERKADGHVGALLVLDQLAQDTNRRLTGGDICRVQKLITSEQHLKLGAIKLNKKYIGRYRDCAVYVGRRMCPAPAAVPPMMRELMGRINLWQTNWDFHSDEANVKTIAAFHFDYEHIHPFGDGNGRSGRALVYYLFRFADLQPFIFTSGDKRETYYPAFADKEMMQEYFLRRYKSKTVR